MAELLHAVDRVIAAMATYAEALGAQEIRVMHPINEDVENYYARFGLTYVAQGDYLYTRVVSVPP